MVVSACWGSLPSQGLVEQLSLLLWAQPHGSTLTVGGNGISMDCTLLMGHVQCPLTKLSRQKQVWALGQRDGMALGMHPGTYKSKIRDMTYPQLGCVKMEEGGCHWFGYFW